MATLAEIRAQYPQYADMPDAALADALYKKFYADMPRAEFDKRMGLASSEGVPGPRNYSWSDLPGNFVTSGLNLYGNLLHPADIIQGTGALVGGALGAPEANEMVARNFPVPARAQTEESKAREAAQNEQMRRVRGAVQEHYKGYLDPATLRERVITDPVGVLADASMVLRGAGGALNVAGKSPTVANALTTAATYTDPLSPVIKAASYPLKWAAPLIDKVFPTAEKTAANITRQAAGDDLNKIRAILDQDKSGLTVQEILADLDRNQIHALGVLAKEKDTTNFYDKLNKWRAQNQQTTLNNLAGGSTNTEILNNLAKSKESLNQVTTPMRETELAAANTGKYKQRLDKQATTLGEIAAGKVDDVRRFVAARDRLATSGAQKGAAQTGMPTPNKYTLEGEMSDAAERVATKAAEESRLYGEGARFAQNRAASLEAHGLKPLDTDGVIRDINAKLNNPKIGVSDVNRKVLTAVANKIKDWTAKNGGVIDVEALYSIRKDTVNEVIDKLMAGQDPALSARRAAKLLAETRPLIDEAIIKAGGTGWKNYLDTFSAGMDVLNQRKMAQVARNLYKESPAAFVALVRGESPELVEKIFGHGRNDIKAEMGSKFQALDNIAHELETSQKVSAGAEKGAAALKDIAKANQPTLRIPYWGIKAAVGNQVLKELSGKISDKTMRILENGFQSGKNFEDMLNEVPFGERGKIYKAMQFMTRGKVTAAASGANMLRENMRKD